MSSLMFVCPSEKLPCICLTEQTKKQLNSKTFSDLTWTVLLRFVGQDSFASGDVGGWGFLSLQNLLFTAEKDLHLQMFAQQWQTLLHLCSLTGGGGGVFTIACEMVIKCPPGVPLQVPLSISTSTPAATPSLTSTWTTFVRRGTLCCGTWSRTRTRWEPAVLLTSSVILVLI